MKVLVTGSAGLIGSNFCHYLLDNVPNIHIVGIDNLSGGLNMAENMPENIHFIKGDLANKEDQSTIEQCFKDGYIDYIFNFAAFAACGNSGFMRQHTYINNCVINAFLINMAITYEIKRFVYTSSMAVYGHGVPPFTEDLIPNPNDTYGIAKFASEMDLRVAYEQHNLEYCIIRPHNVFGKYQNLSDPYRNVLAIWMHQAMNNLPLTIYGDGEQTRSFSYIDDCLPCLWNAAVMVGAKNQIINVGGKSFISLKKAAELIKTITGSHKVVHLEPRHEVKHAWSSYQKSIDVLNYQEITSLQQGIQLMWEWARQQPIRERKFFSRYEIDSNIYSYWKLE